MRSAQIAFCIRFGSKTHVSLDVVNTPFQHECLWLKFTDGVDKACMREDKKLALAILLNEPKAILPIGNFGNLGNLGHFWELWSTGQTCHAAPRNTILQILGIVNQ